MHKYIPGIILEFRRLITPGQKTKILPFVMITFITGRGKV